MSAIIFYILSILFFGCAYSDVNLKQVKCLVCRTIIDEFKHEVKQIDPTRKIEIGQYKLDSVGNAIYKEVPLSKSEVHLSDMLDTVCKKMDDYARATYKSNGKLTLVKLVSDNGVNPDLSQVDFVQDGDLNKSLEYFCTDIVNEHEDDFIEAISKDIKNPRHKICSEIADYCTDFGEDADDENDENENQSYNEEL